jgi:hypothetical protein
MLFPCVNTSPGTAPSSAPYAPACTPSFSTSFSYEFWKDMASLCCWQRSCNGEFNLRSGYNKLNSLSFASVFKRRKKGTRSSKVSRKGDKYEEVPMQNGMQRRYPSTYTSPNLPCTLLDPQQIHGQTHTATDRPSQIQELVWRSTTGLLPVVHNASPAPTCVPNGIGRLLEAGARD